MSNFCEYSSPRSLKKTLVVELMAVMYTFQRSSLGRLIIGRPGPDEEANLLLLDFTVAALVTGVVFAADVAEGVS